MMKELKNTTMLLNEASKFYNSPDFLVLVDGFNIMYAVFNGMHKSFSSIEKGIWNTTNFAYQMDSFFYFLKQNNVIDDVKRSINIFGAESSRRQMKFLRKLVSHPFDFDSISNDEYQKILEDKNIFHSLYEMQNFFEKEQKIQIRYVKNKKFIKANFKKKRWYKKNGIILSLKPISQKNDGIYLEINFYLLLSNYCLFLNENIYKNINKLCHKYIPSKVN